MDLIETILSVLNIIPYQASMVIIAGMILYFVRQQSIMNKHYSDFEKETQEKFQKGITNFTMIDGHFEALDDHLGKIHDEMKLIYKMVLKDIIYNENVDLMERHDAYEQYVRLKGNGFVQAYYNEKIKPKIEEYIRDGRVK